jgi:predicted lipoprotein with Yx(FWY)xxD motif
LRKPRRRAIVRRIFGLGVVAVLVLAGCGKSSNGPAYGGSPSQRSSAGTATLGVNTMKVPGVGTVLVDSGGFTLYHLQGETTSNLKCTGSCLSTWPPLLDNSGATPTRGAGVTGTLSTFSLPNGGTQVAYNGMPLYTFTGDSAPGQAAGQGVANFFAVVA